MVAPPVVAVEAVRTVLSCSVDGALQENSKPKANISKMVLTNKTPFQIQTYGATRKWREDRLYRANNGRERGSTKASRLKSLLMWHDWMP